MGRKALVFDEERLRQIEAMSGVGLTIERMCGVLGISTTAFESHQRKNSSINEAIKRGKGKASFTVGKSLFRRCEEGDIPAIKWWEATRDERSEKTRNEITGKDGEPLAVVSAEPLTADEWQAKHGTPEE